MLLGWDATTSGVDCGTGTAADCCARIEAAASGGASSVDAIATEPLAAGLGVERIEALLPAILAVLKPGASLTVSAAAGTDLSMALLLCGFVETTSVDSADGVEVRCVDGIARRAERSPGTCVCLCGMRWLTPSAPPSRSLPPLPPHTRHARRPPPPPLRACACADPSGAACVGARRECPAEEAQGGGSGVEERVDARGE